MIGDSKRCADIDDEVEGLCGSHLGIWGPGDGLQTDTRNHDVDGLVRAVLEELGELVEDGDTFEIVSINDDDGGIGNAGEDVIVKKDDFGTFVNLLLAIVAGAGHGDAGGDVVGKVLSVVHGRRWGGIERGLQELQLMLAVNGLEVGRTWVRRQRVDRHGRLHEQRQWGRDRHGARDDGPRRGAATATATAVSSDVRREMRLRRRETRDEMCLAERRRRRQRSGAMAMVW